MPDAAPSPIIVRPLVASDLAAADRIIRLAFGTFVGLRDPSQYMGDADYARARWKADPSAVLAAEENGRFIGSNFAANWGSFGFFGPLTIDPAYWDRGVAQQLLVPTMDIFRRWGNRHLGLYTFAQSAKHIALYQKFGFWPRDLVAVMAREAGGASAPSLPDTRLFSAAPAEEQSALLAACREVTDANFDGLDLEREIRAVCEQKLGDTILLWDGAQLAAFAVCHVGAGTEAGTGVCYVKFAAVRPSPEASSRAGVNFTRLLDAVESFASAAGAPTVKAGVNLARREAFREMLARGFRTQAQGVAMESGGPGAGYNRAGVYILDDWR